MWYQWVQFLEPSSWQDSSYQDLSNLDAWRTGRSAFWAMVRQDQQAFWGPSSWVPWGKDIAWNSFLQRNYWWSSVSRCPRQLAHVSMTSFNCCYHAHNKTFERIPLEYSEMRYNNAETSNECNTGLCNPMVMGCVQDHLSVISLHGIRLGAGLSCNRLWPFLSWDWWHCNLWSISSCCLCLNGSYTLSNGNHRIWLQLGI